MGQGRTCLLSGPPESCPSLPLTSDSPTFTDELQKLLLEQMELRKKLEREFQSLKGTPIPTHPTPSPEPCSHSGPPVQAAAAAGPARPDPSFSRVSSQAKD